MNYAYWNFKVSFFPYGSEISRKWLPVGPRQEALKHLWELFFSGKNTEDLSLNSVSTIFKLSNHRPSHELSAFLLCTLGILISIAENVLTHVDLWSLHNVDIHKQLLLFSRCRPCELLARSAPPILHWLGELWGVSSKGHAEVRPQPTVPHMTRGFVFLSGSAQLTSKAGVQRHHQSNRLKRSDPLSVLCLTPSWDLLGSKGRLFITVLM